MRAEIMQITLNVNILLFLTRDVLCHVQGSKHFQRRLQANWVWIRDILIEFTERFFSGFARSSSFDFFVKRKVLRQFYL